MIETLNPVKGVILTLSENSIIFLILEGAMKFVLDKSYFFKQHSNELESMGCIIIICIIFIEHIIHKKNSYFSKAAIKNCVNSFTSILFETNLLKNVDALILTKTL